jgi:hypothetical protein
LSLKDIFNFKKKVEGKKGIKILVDQLYDYSSSERREATIQFFEGNTSNAIGGMSSLSSCIAPSFTVQAGTYYISASKPSTVFTSTPA